MVKPVLLPKSLRFFFFFNYSWETKAQTEKDWAKFLWNHST